MHQDPPAGKLYNLDKLKEISRGNDAFVKRMIQIFYDRIPSSLAQIKEAYTAKDFKKVRDVAHLLKPSIDNMGILSIKKDIRNIEELAIENPESPILAESINNIARILMQVSVQLEEELR